MLPRHMQADDLMADLSIIVDDIEVIKINHNAILSAFQNTGVNGICIVTVCSEFVLLGLVEAQKQNEQKHEEIRKLSHRITDELKSELQSLD